MKKNALKSKTIWFNLLSIALVVIGTNEFKDIIGDHASILFMLQSVINIALRFVTKEPVKLTKEESEILDIY